MGLWMWFSHQGSVLSQLKQESSAHDVLMQRRLAKEAKEEEKLRKNAEKVHSPHLTFIELQQSPVLMRRCRSQNQHFCQPFGTLTCEAPRCTWDRAQIYRDLWQHSRASIAKCR